MFTCRLFSRRFFISVRYLYIPSGFGVILLKGGSVVLRMTGAIPTMDEALTENSPSLPLLMAVRNTEITQSSVTIVVKFKAKSTIRLPQL